MDNWMPIRLGRLPAFGGRVLGGRTGRLHCGSGARMDRRVEQSGIEEVTYLGGQLTTDQNSTLSHVLFSTPPPPLRMRLLYVQSRAVRLRSSPKNLRMGSLRTNR